MTPGTGVRVVYRYAAGGNFKARPPYFSKELALASFVRACRAAEGRAHVTFLVDGDLPPHVGGTMDAAGEVVRGAFGSNRESYRHAMTLARSMPVREPLLWFAEDDYLYEPGSLVSLLAAADAVPEASWFALSGPTPPVMLEMRRAQGPVRVPPLARPGGVADVEGRAWHRIDSTTSTFGGRTSVVARDERLMRAVPFTGAAWDRTTCLTVQGHHPLPVAPRAQETSWCPRRRGHTVPPAWPTGSRPGWQ
jgi:hypothetical protein